MEHTIIKTAFENAKAFQKGEKDTLPIIYMSFQRRGLFYKDTYYILSGNEADVKIKIDKCYEETKCDREEDWRADGIELLDTPFDTFCSGSCQINKCDENQKDKCGSHWIATEFNTKKELDDYIISIPTIKSYYGHLDVIYMTKNGLEQFHHAMFT